VGQNRDAVRLQERADRSPTPDERNAEWAAGPHPGFRRAEERPALFLGVGFIRPHTPLHVPQRYFDLFPPDKVEMPLIKTGDAEDTHYKDVFDAETKGLKYFRLLKASYPNMEAGIKAFTRAYLPA
jgi:iduronate 2-sulfatase